MGKASIKTDFVGMDILIRKWSQAHKVAIAHKFTPNHYRLQGNPADFVEIMGKGVFTSLNGNAILRMTAPR